MPDPRLRHPRESEWANVDRAADAARMQRGLDRLRREPFFALAKQRMDALVPPDAARVVDVGCGTGEDSVRDAHGDRAWCVAIDRSVQMVREARRRHPDLVLAVADGRRLPLAAGSVDAVRADRVLQHLAEPEIAVREWRRVLGPGGVLLTFDPDPTAIAVNGVDPERARRVLEWRASTRPGTAVVHGLAGALAAAGYVDIDVVPSALELDTLDRADGIMGLADWGALAADAGFLEPGEARQWREDVEEAHRSGVLRFRAEYRLGIAHAP